MNLLTTKDVADLLEVNRTTITRICNRHGIGLRSKYSRTFLADHIPLIKRCLEENRRKRLANLVR